jgi:HD-GYP domain-containing protein (c-di-GMP phosphodiesterase class II)
VYVPRALFSGLRVRLVVSLLLVLAPVLGLILWTADLSSTHRLIAIVLAAALLLVAWWASGAFFLRPMSTLSAVIDRLANGDWKAYQSLPRGTSEFDALARRLMDLAIAFEARDLKQQEAQTHIQNYADRLAALHSIDKAISANLALPSVLDVILDQVRNHLRADAADVLLFNSHTHDLEYAAARGFRTNALQYTRLRLGEGHAGAAALEQRMVGISDLRADAGDFTRAPQMAKEDFVAYFAVPLIARGQVKGVLEIFHRTALTPPMEWLDFMQALAAQAAIAIDHAALFGDLQRSNTELALAYDATIEGWSRALDLRDAETEGHTQRVAQMAVTLAQAAGIEGDELIHVRRGALLHDIGKMSIPDNILLKPGPLSDEEWQVMRRHPVYAYQLLQPIEFLHPAIDIPYCHHEKWDGTGYPRGLKGEEIPLTARIFAVIDVWDALSSERPYRAAWEREQIATYLREQAGRHFDPRMVEMFFRKVVGNGASISQKRPIRV